jgi:uncharacterized protein (DUF2141 family)
MCGSRHQLHLLWAAALALTGACASAAFSSNGRSGRTAQPSTTPATASADAVLTVEVKDLRDRKGDLIFGVFSQADGFPDVQAKSVYWDVKPADADVVTFTTRLPPGHYAAGVLHDENRDGKMDLGLGGIPLEGYGVTNNPKPRFRKATFQEATFMLPPDGATMTISLEYFQPGSRH